MRKFLFRIYDHLVLETNKNTNRFNLFIKPIFGVLEYYLFPEFRNIGKIKRIVKSSIKGFSLVLLLFIFCFISYSFGVFDYQEQTSHFVSLIKKERTEKKEMREKVNSLILNNLDLHNKNKNLELEILIKEVEKVANIKIPETLPKNHFLLMLEESNNSEIPIDIFFRLIYAESKFDSSAVSKKGAEGYMQIMPATYEQCAKELGISDKYTAKSNIKIGSYYLKKQKEYWEGRGEKGENLWKLVLASYNAGPTLVRRLNRVPNIPETLNYVDTIINS